MPDGQTGDVTDVGPSHIAPHTSPLLLTDAVVGSRGGVPAALSPSEALQSAGQGTGIVTFHSAGQVSLGSPGQTWKTGAGERREGSVTYLPRPPEDKREHREL